MWSIDFAYHLWSLVPTFLRKPKRMAWLAVMMSQLKVLHDEFIAFRTVANREAKYNGQVMVLERMLNLNYYDEDIWASPPDPTAGGHIWIEHTLSNIDMQFIWDEEENQPTFFIYDEVESNPDQVYLYDEEEYFNVIAFKVWVPVALAFEEAEMRARIDKYIIAGFNYEIVTY